MHEVTRILRAIEGGDPGATEQLLPVVYDELRRLATHQLSRERSGQTIQPTALVHEVYLRLVGAEHEQTWESRGHFFAAAARAMRRILIENARRDRSLKRGGGRERIEQDLDAIAEPDSEVDLLALNEALIRFGAKDPRKAQLVELRFFSGLTMQQAADVMGISVASAHRDWAYARAWLHREMAGEGPGAG